MTSYEFWDELGKIFSAVVSYQEKNIEFNKRFIVPWIRLGNVFDKKDRNEAAVNAYQQAIQIDPRNAQNWFELGNVHFKAQEYSDAIHAFNRAIELDPGLGWSYSNLGLTLVTLGEHEQAIPLYRKSIDLLRENKDKAVAWNRLGNAYRKLNQYELALQAFHQADELDKDNAGFRDDLDEVAEGPTLMQSMPDGSGMIPSSLKVSPIELIVAQSRAEEAASQYAETGHAPSGARVQPVDPQPTVKVDTREIHEALPAKPQPEHEVADTLHEKSADSAETVTVVVPNTVETFTQPLPTSDDSTDTSQAVLRAKREGGPAQEAPNEEAQLTPMESADPAFPETSEVVEAARPATDAESTAAASEPGAAIEQPEFAAAEVEPAAVVESEAAQLEAEHNAYEEYLKDNDEPVHAYAPAVKEEPEDAPAPAPVAKLDPTGDVQIEMDTKNAHVWNELGNVYFNTGAFDDSIVAYSKAIELDRWFAWPYSNLALAYVQKRRFVEAILLYQRSIELFTSDKDKAISWNRLGNVYRRLNDYENAIAAYQRADALDPDNATLSLQSRFSLLGNYATDRKPSYVS